MQTELAKPYISAAVTDRGLSEKRPQNEDSYLELSEYGVFAVADGVGGAQAGDVASQMAVEILAEAFTNQTPNADAEETMKAALERANGAIFQMATDLPQLSSMATTVAALHVKENIATIGHVGDSRVYSIDPRGKLRRETADHSVVEEEVRAGRMTIEQALNHPSRNIISRALGAENDVEVELKTVMVEPGTTFLLCSDGITRHIPDVELEEIIGAGSEPEEVTKRLKDLCYERGAEDNLTAIIVRIADSEEPHDEATVATARTFSEDTAVGIASSADSARAEDVNAKEEALAEVTDAEDEPYSTPLPLDTAPTRTEKEDEYPSSSTVVPAQPEPAPVVPDVFEKYSAPVEPARDGSFTKLVSAMILLLVGGALGAAAYHFLLQPQPQPQAELLPPPALIEKSPDVPLTAFEEGRRLVDNDPAAFLNANAASPQDAEDYFLLGRASLLTGKHWEAKRAFIEARNRLAQADPKNAKTLAAEISLAIAVIESPGASLAFSREIAAGSSAAENTNVATGTNSTSNTNTPVNILPVR